MIFIKFAGMFLSNVLYHTVHACINIDLQVGYILRGLIYIAHVYLSTPAHTTYILAYSFAFTHHP